MKNFKWFLRFEWGVGKLVFLNLQTIYINLTNTSGTIWRKYWKKKLQNWRHGFICNTSDKVYTKNGFNLTNACEMIPWIRKYFGWSTIVESYPVGTLKLLQKRNTRHIFHGFNKMAQLILNYFQGHSSVNMQTNVTEVNRSSVTRELLSWSFEDLL